MRFAVSEKVFKVLNDVCFGVVVAKGISNVEEIPAISDMLVRNIAICEDRFEGKKVKDSPFILPYREAFSKLGVNPNKYMCSIEALLTRISKKKGFPSINPAVDLGNAISIKYNIPIGAHDLGTIRDSLTVRFSEPDDHFIAFGETESEVPDVGELIYVSDHEVRTRRWTWRQSEVGKITDDTTSILFPLDGFRNFNEKEVISARNELADCLKNLFNCNVVTGFVDSKNPVYQFD